MDDQVRRPLSVWLTQALFLMVILQFAIALLLMVFLCFSKGGLEDCWSPSNFMSSREFWGVSTDESGVLGTLERKTIWQMVRRDHFGRFDGGGHDSQPLLSTGLWSGLRGATLTRASL